MFEKIELTDSQKNYLIIFLLSLHVLLWAEPGRIIVGGDVTLPKLSSMLYAWFNSTDGGYPFTSFTWIIWNGFLEIFSYISLDFAYRIYFLLLTFMSGAGMYYFTSILTDNNKHVSLLAAIIYMFNSFVFTAFTILYVYAVIPPMLGFFIKGIKTMKLKYFLFFSLLTPILFLVFPNLTFPLIALILMLCFLFFYGDFGKRNIKRTFKLILAFTLVFVLINAWWLVPGLYNILSFFDPLSEIKEVMIPTFSFSITSAFRWLGVWAFETFDTSGTFQGRLYYPFIETIQTNPFLILLSFLPFIMAFSAIFFKPKDRNVLFFSFLALIAIFFAKGPNEPFGSIYSGLMSNISFFKFFRDTNRLMYLVTLAYSFLIAVTIEQVSSRFKGTFRTAIPVALIGLLLINSWPLITGDVAVNWYDPEHRGVKIPSYYYDADEWFSEQGDYYRIMVLPRPSGYIANKWGYQGANILHYTMSKPLIIGSSFGGTYITADNKDSMISISGIYDDFEANRSRNFTKILGLLNVKYVVVDSSVDTEFYSMPPINRTIELLEHEVGIKKVREFGDLLVYRNDFFIPHAYATSDITYFPGTLESPDSIGWRSDMKDATPILGNTSVENGYLKLSGRVNGSYFSYVIEKTLSIDPKEYKYLLVDFYADEDSDLVIQINTGEEIIYPLALNPPQYENVPPNPALNHYRSLKPYTLVFRIPEEIEENITKVVVFASNQISPNHMGDVNIWVGNVSIVKSIGLIKDEQFDAASDNVLVFAHHLSLEQKRAMENIVRNEKDGIPDKKAVSIREENPSRYVIGVESNSPYFLVLGENYNPEWKAYMDGKELENHFAVNGYANGWYVEEAGNHEIVIEFFPQNILYAFAAVSLVSTIGLMYLAIIKRYEIC